MKKVILLTLLLTCCNLNSRVSEKNAEPAPNTGVQLHKINPVSEAVSIRQTDFQNFEYPLFACVLADKPTYDEVEKVTTKDGAYDKEEGDDILHFKVLEVAYGDLNGDGKEEALIPTSCNMGGSGSFGSTLVYTMKNGTAQFMTDLELLRDIKVTDAVISGTYDYGPPEHALSLKFFKMSGAEIKEIEKPALGSFTNEGKRRRIQFEKGSIGAILHESTRPGEVHTYVLRAGEGQQLCVFFKGEAPNDYAEVLTEKPSPAVTDFYCDRLSKSADYEVRVYASGRYSLEVTVK